MTRAGCAVLVALLPTTAFAQPFVAASAAIPAGGGTIQGAGLRTTSTIGGVAFAGPALSGADGEGRPYRLVGGFAPTVGIAGALPTLLAAIPSTGPASGATALTLTGARLGGVLSVTIGGRPARHVMSVDGATVTVFTPSGAPGPADIVLTTGSGSATLSGGFTYGAQWFRHLAEGAISPGWFDTRIALVNPEREDVRATVTYLAAGRDPAVPPPGETISIPAHGRVTLDPARVLAEAAVTGAAFSTVIESDRRIAADRTMGWPAASPSAAHAEQAVEEASIRWHFAEGATHGGFDLFYLIENPNAVDARAQVRFLLPAPLAPVTATYDVPARSRVNVWVDHEASVHPAMAVLGNSDVSVDVTSVAHVTAAGARVPAQPLFVERAMYLTHDDGAPFQGGTASAGVAEPLRRWYFAEGATGDFFDLYLLLANPNPAAATADVRFLLTDGRVYRKTVHVAGESRLTLPVDLLDGLAGDGGTPDPPAAERALAAAAFSMVVDATAPLVAERAMWWPDATGRWTEGHASHGVAEPGTRWAVAGGEFVAHGPGRAGVATFVLIANTSAHEGLARVSPLCDGPQPSPLPRIFRLPPTSRTTVNGGAPPMADADGYAPDGSGFGAALDGRRCGFLVESLQWDALPLPQLVVERATYHTPEAGWPFVAGANATGTLLR